MKTIFIQFFAAALVLSTGVQAAGKSGKASSKKVERPTVCEWNYEHMLEMRSDLSRNENSKYKGNLATLIRHADNCMQAPVVAITDKADQYTAPSGDKRDFMSIGSYSFPNPDTPDGMPWIRKDGAFNPTADLYDLKARLAPASRAMNTLGLAYFYTGNEEYARKAAEYASVWFVDPSTRMNPNMKYAACLPGHNNGNGYFYGLIQGTAIKDCLIGLSLLKGSKAYTPAIDAGVRQWVGELYTWFTTSDMGKEEKAMKNNHAMAFYVQAMAYALFIGKNDAIPEMTKEIRELVISKQIEPDGRQPHELARPSAYNYTVLNLDYLIEACIMAKDIDPDLFSYTSLDGRSISKGLDFAMQYLGKKVEDFAPYKEVQGWVGRQRYALWVCAAASTLDPSGRYAKLFEANKNLDHANSVNYLKY